MTYASKFCSREMNAICLSDSMDDASMEVLVSVSVKISGLGYFLSRQAAGRAAASKQLARHLEADFKKVHSERWAGSLAAKRS